MSTPAVPGVHALVERCRTGDTVTYDAIQSAVYRAVLVQVAPAGTAAAITLAGRAQRYASLDRHPALPVVHDAGQTDDGWVFVVRSRHLGTTLTQFLEERGGLAWKEAAHLGSDVAAALQVLHAGGIVNGGVGPDAVRRRDDGGWLLDEPLDPENLPEVAQPADDVLGLARALERALGGLVTEGVPNRLTDVVLASLSPLAAERPSAGEVYDELSALQSSSGDTSASTASTTPRAAAVTRPRDSNGPTRAHELARGRWARFPRARVLVGLGAVLGFAVLAGVAVVVWPDARVQPAVSTAAAPTASREPTMISSSSPTASPSPTETAARALAPYEKNRRPGELVWDGRYFWMSLPASGTVRRDSFRRQAADDDGGDVELRAGREPGALAVGKGVIWVANTRDGTVLGLNLKTLEETARITVGGTPTGIAVTPTYLWVVDHAAGELVRVDLRNQSRIRRVKVGRHPFEVEVARGVAWVTLSGERRLARVEGGTMQVTYVRVGRRPLGLDIAFGSVWVANYDDGTWTRVDEKTGRVIQTGASGKGPFAVSAGRPAGRSGTTDNVVMIANERSRNVRMLILRQGRVVVSRLVLPEPATRSQQRRDMVAVNDVGACAVTMEERRYAWTVACLDNG